MRSSVSAGTHSLHPIAVKIFGFWPISRHNKTFLSFLLGSMHQLYKGERRVGRSQCSNSPTDSHAIATTTGLRSHRPLPLLIANTNQPSRQISPVEPATTWTSACSHTPRTALSSTITPPTKPLPLNQAPPTHPPRSMAVSASPGVLLKHSFILKVAVLVAKDFQIAAPHSSSCMCKIVKLNLNT